VKKVLCILLIFLSPFGDVAANTKEIHVAMVLWRGMTDAELGFQQALTDLSYITDYTIINADQNRAALATKLRIELMPYLSDFDYIYSFGTTATQMVKVINHSTTPHIFNIVTDPVGAGIANSIASAGNKLSGVSHRISLSSQIENAQKIKTLNRVAFFFNPREKNSDLIRTELLAIANDRDFDIQEFRSPPAKHMLEDNLKLLGEQMNGIDAVYFPLDSYLASEALLIGQRLKGINVLSIGALKEYVTAGVLLGLVPDYFNLGRQAASILDRHVKGESLSNIPIYTKTNPKVLINETTRKLLEVDIPTEIYRTATILN
jgi:ABC-type uncharacterized transport system substrate-binding protein